MILSYAKYADLNICYKNMQNNLVYVFFHR